MRFNFFLGFNFFLKHLPTSCADILGSTTELAIFVFEPSVVAIIVFANTIIPLVHDINILW